MAQHFLFLEVLDPEINALILAITEILSGERPTKPAHLTVRGPYKRPIPEKVIETCVSEMRYDALRIGNVGRFSNPDEEVVYFQVDSPHLRKIWRKPTFQIAKFGFNPHFTLYRGKDRQLAEIAENFLVFEKVELLCAEFRLVPYLTKQMLLHSPDFPVSKQFPRLIDSGRVHETFLQRLIDLASQYKSDKTVQMGFGRF